MKRVLIVDDMLSVRALVKLYLVEFGFKFMEASNGREGLTIARVEQPDLMLLDLMMPVMTGEECLRQLRQDPILSKTPVIVLSASDVEAHQIPQGPRTFVAHKPVTPAELKAVVKTALQI